jgi:hypothetical protein
MDDFVLSNLHESRNEWCSRLVSIFTPLVFDGIRSIFNESWKLCIENDEVGKYLMTFQNLLSRVPKWNSVIVEEEKKRIIERSGCNYLEDLITCVHIIQLKVLTCIRVGNKQKKIDISIPKLDTFVHKIYIHVARKVYMNVYLFEKNVTPLQIQKNNRELELMIQECILTTIRESIPTEDIIRAYMDESVEQEEEVVIENITEPDEENDDKLKSENLETLEREKEKEKEREKEEDKIPVVPSIQNLDNNPVITRLSFNDYDAVLNSDTGNIENVNAPKTIDRLEEISTSRAIQRKLEEEGDSLNDRIKIHTDNIDLGNLDVFDIDKNTKFGNNMSEDVLLDGIEELI